MSLQKSILISLLTWPLFALVQIPLYILGWILVPIAAALKAHTKTPVDGLDGNGQPRVDYHFTWKFMYVWDNWEDGICAGRQYLDLPGEFLQIVYWSCVRNPINNTRVAPILSCTIDPKRVKYIGSRGWPQEYDKKPASSEYFYAWCGVYANLWWQFKVRGSVYRLWIGHKIMPIWSFFLSGQGCKFYYAVKEGWLRYEYSF
jgi:hypothetical protein